MVGTSGLEPLTSSVSRKRSNQLSYAPTRLDFYCTLRAQSKKTLESAQAYDSLGQVARNLQPGPSANSWIWATRFSWRWQYPTLRFANPWH